MKTLAALLLSVSLVHADWHNLWPDTAPGAKQPPAGTETTNEHGHKGNIEIPQYQVYLPEADKATGAAVIILPGGGYGILAMEHEGHEYAKWLNQRGIAGIVVKYRVGSNLGYQYPVPFLDARRAIRTARAHASEWNLKLDRIGVMGSSAGGHLASLCATRFQDVFPEETSDEIDSQSARPDFAILCYPVIAMDSPVGHTGSRRNLAGENASPELLTKLSTDKAVTAETPPIFMVHTADDPVDCRNSLQLAAACRENNVPFALHIFEKGGHGYGLRTEGSLSQWPDLLHTWLTQLWK